MTCPDLPPDLIAYADQRIACTAEFLNRMVTGEANDVAFRGSDDPIAVCAFSKTLDEHLTAEGAMSDALALAIRRLAAHHTGSEEACS